MAKKKRKEIDLDDLEKELEDVEEVETEKVDEIEAKEEEEIEEIEEFEIKKVSEEEEIEEIFEEGIEGEEIEEIGAPKEEIIDERIYIVPLTSARKGPRNKWAKKSIRYLREYMNRHFKPESLVISQDVNEKIWERGAQKPPRKLKIRATKNIDGLVVVYLA